LERTCVKSIHFDSRWKSCWQLKMNFFKDHAMFQHVRKFNKNIFEVSFLRKRKKMTLQILMNSGDHLSCTIKNYKQHILFCTRLRFSFIIQKNYKVPMQNLSTTPKKTDLNSEKKRLECRPQLQPKEATLQMILQFASTYRAERTTENQYVEWYLN